MKKRLRQLLEQLQQSPRDVRLLQKIADLDQHSGDEQLAAKYWALIAEQYAADGFLLKAIAVMNQVLRVVEWHERLGFQSEADAWRARLPGG